MKKLYTLFSAAMLCLFTGAYSQNCTSSANNYDLVVVANTTIPPNASPNYMQGYVCNGGVLLDSALCCTRFVNVDSGGTMIVGPNSYGIAYVLNGGTFNGQGSSNNWTVVAEPNATVINHTGNLQPCSTITYNPSSCTMGTPDPSNMKPAVSLNGTLLNFGFHSVVNVTIELVDVTGKAVRSEQVNRASVHSMNVEGLASGVYMYRVMQNGEVISSDKLILGQ